MSLRSKILFVLGLMLLIAVGLYTALASSIFREEKRALIFDVNHSVAVNTSALLRSSLLQTSEDLRLVIASQLLASQNLQGTKGLALSNDFFEKHNLLGLRLYKKANTFVEIPSPPNWPALNAPANVQNLILDAFKNESAFSSVVTNEPHFYLAERVEVREGSATDVYLAVAEVHARILTSAMQASNIYRSYLVKRDGTVLLFCEKNEIHPAPNLEDHPLVLAYRKSPSARTGVLSYHYNDEDWLGAFAPIGMADLLFIAEANRSETLGAVRTLINRSILFALIVITGTFIVSILFSNRLTRPLRLLTEASRQIGEGNLSSRIDITGDDEVGELSSSFNSMAEKLQVSREAIEQQNRDLEKTVEERTKELHDINAEIREMQEKVFSSNQMALVGEMAGRTAHEILNPLTAILNRLEKSFDDVGQESSYITPLHEIITAWENDFREGGLMLLTTNLSKASSLNPNTPLVEEDLNNLKNISTGLATIESETKADLGFINEQAQRIYRIVDSMREYVRSAEKSDTECLSAIKEGVETMQDFLNKHGISMTLEMNANRSVAFLNRDELIQILTNLIRNSMQAIDSSKKTGGKIHIACYNLRDSLIVDVVDNGPGIAPSLQKQVFEQGFTTKKPSEGTGLGLAICRRYARSFSGEVELAYSDPSTRGTCFRISIPLKETETKAA